MPLQEPLKVDREVVSLQTILTNTRAQMSWPQILVLWTFISACMAGAGHPIIGYGFGAVMLCATLLSWQGAWNSERDQRYSELWSKEMIRRSELPDGGHRDCIHGVDEMREEHWQPPGFKRTPHGRR